jgi:hypothetical protein
MRAPTATPIKIEPFDKEATLAPLPGADENGFTGVVGEVSSPAVSVGDNRVALRIALSNPGQILKETRTYEGLDADIGLNEKEGIEAVPGNVAEVNEKSSNVILDVLVVVLVAVPVKVSPPEEVKHLAAPRESLVQVSPKAERRETSTCVSEAIWIKHKLTTAEGFTWTLDVALIDARVVIRNARLSNRTAPWFASPCATVLSYRAASISWQNVNESASSAKI